MGGADGHGEGGAMDREITGIVNKALDGALLTRKEIVALLSVENLSPEAFAIQQAGRAFTASLCSEEAEIHAHIGLDAAPCPNDCKFCSFAASNKIFKKHEVIPLDKVIEEAVSMEAAGANALYLVTTVHYGEERFLETAQTVRAALKTNIPLIANVPDFNGEYARELARIGIAGVYHVVRLGEGVYTRCKVEDRLETMQATKDAGLVLGNCIDPIGPEHSPEEIADLILLARTFEVGFSGAMRRNTVGESVFTQYGNISYGRLATYVGATALATGTGIRGNCTHEPSQLCGQAGANIMWAERGTSPRDVTAETTRGLSVGQVRDIYFNTDWNVRKGPSQFYPAYQA